MGNKSRSSVILRTWLKELILAISILLSTTVSSALKLMDLDYTIILVENSLTKESRTST